MWVYPSLGQVSNVHFTVHGGPGKPPLGSFLPFNWSGSCNRCPMCRDDNFWGENQYPRAGEKHSAANPLGFKFADQSCCFPEVIEPLVSQEEKSEAMQVVSERCLGKFSSLSNFYIPPPLQSLAPKPKALPPIPACPACTTSSHWGILGNACLPFFSKRPSSRPQVKAKLQLLVWNVRVFHIVFMRVGFSRGKYKQRHPRERLSRERKKKKKRWLLVVSLGPGMEKPTLEF